MARNYVKPGNVLTLTAPSGGVVSGGGYVVGDLFVIAVHNAAEGEPFEGNAVGAWDLPKASSDPWGEGVKVYWDGTQATTVATDNHLIGHSAAVADADAPTGLVRLQP
ncbi:DUF2190 family protein [Marinobacter sp. CA1]|uniref:DUF2190 family protein n=1 Tax=Marinobacter sp. CA1 TaxID=2817656 RepID=UPI001D06AFBA|nr:DUF2190 family protein [Marinobacter sp. CA1]UDL03979.1 DUF2190 family protein [Marinobacter sp. CA1]